MFLLYTIAVLLEKTPKIDWYFRIAFIPYVIYTVLVLINPFTDMLYYFSETDGFVFGPGSLIVYLIPSLYMITMILFIVAYRKKIERTRIAILVSFPAISLIMLFFQWVWPTIILSGSSAAAALLIVYLYLQNKQIIFDELTGLQNRKAFLNALSLYVDRKQKIDVLLISLDNFKTINNRFGQTNGDKLLISISHYLVTVSQKNNVFRYGGDEFAIILDDIGSSRATDLVDTIYNKFLDYWEYGVYRSTLTASLAVVKFPDHADTLEKIITLMEFCIVLAKKDGKSKAIFSDKKIASELIRDNLIIERLKLGMATDSFHMVYQPIYSRKEDQFTMAEALLRFNDSELGMIPPNEFIPIAERSGLINELTFMVLDKVCKFILNIEKQHVKFDAISINISILDLNSPNFVDNCLKIINQNGVSPSKLRFEVTENIFIENYKQIYSILKTFNENEIKFFMDDFGTGYANINNIISLPFECIKLDKSLLEKAVSDPKCFGIIKGLNITFSEIGMKTLIEGVETSEEYLMVEDINFDFIQGYFLARPMPPADAILYFGRKFRNTNLYEQPK